MWLLLCGVLFLGETTLDLLTLKPGRAGVLERTEVVVWA